MMLIVESHQKSMVPNGWLKDLQNNAGCPTSGYANVVIPNSLFAFICFEQVDLYCHPTHGPTSNDVKYRLVGSTTPNLGPYDSALPLGFNASIPPSAALAQQRIDWQRADASHGSHDSPSEECPTCGAAPRGRQLDTSRAKAMDLGFSTSQGMRQTHLGDEPRGFSAIG